MLKDGMNLVDDMVGACVEPSNVRHVPLLLIEYLSVWKFLCGGWKWTICICCWGSWTLCDGLGFEMFGGTLFWEGSREFLDFESISWIGFSERLVGSTLGGFGEGIVPVWGLSRKMCWGKDVSNIFDFLTLLCSKPPSRTDTTLWNINTTSSVCTIKLLRWVRSFGWLKRLRNLWHFSTAALLVFSTPSIFTVHTDTNTRTRLQSQNFNIRTSVNPKRWFW